jgi:23S rRNA pseudouridine1911/1915/1917 synthase
VGTGESRRVELVVEDDASERLDTYIAARTDLSRSRVVALIADGQVLLNDQPALKSHLPATGDVITVHLPPPVPSVLEAEDIPLDIVFEDADLLVVNKAAGMVVHPAPGNRTGTLVNALLYAVRDLSGIGGVTRPGIVHRLDRDTSGLLLVAKNDQAHRRLAEDLKRRRIRRRYLVAAWGHLDQPILEVNAPIGRHPGERKKMAVVEDGRRAVTRFRRLERWRSADLLEAELDTGRTHQIRVHLAHRGHPVVGDRVYGEARERGFSGTSRAWARELASRVPRQFLHATELKFSHPTSGDEMTMSAPLPADLEAVAEWARI